MRGDNTEGFILVAIFVLGVLAICLVGFGIDHAFIAERMHTEHREYVRHQEMCIAHNGWYVHEEEYHGLISCHRLDTHEQFYMVPSTGLALVPVID